LSTKRLPSLSIAVLVALATALFVVVSGWPGEMSSHASSATVLSSSEAVTTPLQAKVGSFSKRLGVGDQQITGVGFRPKALILFGTTQSSEGVAGGYQVSVGFSDGSNSGSIGGWSWDHHDYPVGGSDADCAQVDEAGLPAALLYVETIGGIAAAATVRSFDSDGFTLNWSVDKYGKPWIIHYLAIGGDELTNARVGMLDAANHNTGSMGYQIGFQPDLVFFLAVRYRTVYPHLNYPLNLSLGFATDALHQGTAAVASEDAGRNPTDTWRYQRSDRCIAFLSPTSGELESEARFVSMNNDGFTLDWTDAASEDRSFYYLALKGGSYYVGHGAQPPGTTGPIATTGLGFEPVGLFLASSNQPASNVNQANNRLSLGAASASEQQASIWVGDTDNVVNDTHTDKGSFGEAALVLADTDSPTTPDAVAMLRSFDPDGYTLEWSKTDADPRQFLSLAFGSTPRGGESAVGGVAERPFSGADLSPNRRGPSRPDALVLAGLVAGGALLLAAGLRSIRG
jgi:hypothetical protein